MGISKHAWHSVGPRFKYYHCQILFLPATGEGKRDKGFETYYLMWSPLSSYHRNIKINITNIRHFALVYLLGITRLMLTGSTAQELSINT